MFALAVFQCGPGQHRFERLVQVNEEESDEWIGEATLEALTDWQLEVLRTVFKEGFYEVPSEATIDDGAVELDIDGGTGSEALQRAERNIRSQHLTATREGRGGGPKRR